MIPSCQSCLLPKSATPLVAAADPPAHTHKSMNRSEYEGQDRSGQCDAACSHGDPGAVISVDYDQLARMLERALSRMYHSRDNRPRCTVPVHGLCTDQMSLLSSGSNTLHGTQVSRFILVHFASPHCPFSRGIAGTYAVLAATFPQICT
eukprot:SAG11_NODE_2276_length_3583_cov_2.156429_6_plen_149_part_00